MTYDASVPIAVQLYSLRTLSSDFEQILKAARDAGYRAVELVQTNLSAERVVELLERYELKVVSAHVPFAALNDQFDETIAFHKAIGNRHLILPVPTQEVRESNQAAAWRAFGQRLNGLGQRCLAHNLQLGYHNHAFEMVELEGKRAIDWLLQSSQADIVTWEPDLAWIAKGGADPVALLQTYAGRCPRIHAKDLAPAGVNEDQMGLADVGHGILDWDTILAAAKSAGAEWYVVEHDKPRDPVASVSRSLTFLQSKAALL